MCISAASKSQKSLKFLKLAYWNIHGVKSKIIGDKLSDTEFLDKISDSDIVGLTELHTDDEVFIPGFKLIKQKIREKSHKGPKVGGGIAIFVKNFLQDSVHLVPNKNEDSIWVKVKQSPVGQQKDIYIGTFYVSPTNQHNSNKEDFFSVLNEEINTFDKKGTVIIQGDLNARIGKNKDFLTQDKYDETFGILNSNKQYDRNSEDSTVNTRGNDLIDFCKTNDYLIVNGRKLGDVFGNYTSHQ